jgi:hypothetical protein
VYFNIERKEGSIQRTLRRRTPIKRKTALSKVKIGIGVFAFQRLKPALQIIGKNIKSAQIILTGRFGKGE